jgi:SAM domain (Sterile alpha motif)
MSDITPWLLGLGLEKYDEVLASHDIDLAVVPVLAELDLEQLGLSLGHRRKFFRCRGEASRSRGFPG